LSFFFAQTGINRREMQSPPPESPDFDALGSCCAKKEIAMKKKGKRLQRG
jgi:hypothetical protein